VKGNGIFSSWEKAVLLVIFVGMLAVNWLAFRFANASHGEWRAWFAWRPVRIHGRVFWLIRVERALTYTPDLISFKRWRYRRIEHAN